MRLHGRTEYDRESGRFIHHLRKPRRTVAMFGVLVGLAAGLPLIPVALGFGLFFDWLGSQWGWWHSSTDDEFIWVSALVAGVLAFAVLVGSAALLRAIGRALDVSTLQLAGWALAVAWIPAAIFFTTAS